MRLRTSGWAQAGLAGCVAIIHFALVAETPAQAPERPGRPAAGSDAQQLLLKRFDDNGNGRLDPAEIARARTQMSTNRGNSDQAREMILKRFDANGNGQLEPAEMAKAREAMQGRPGQPGAGTFDREALLKRFDANGDGQIDETERAKAREAFERLRTAGNRDNLPGAAVPDQPTRLNRSALLDKFDTNSNGKLDPEERQAATAELRKQRQN